MRQFVTFRADDHLLGIDILMVREINRLLDITPVQHARDYVHAVHEAWRVIALRKGA